MLQSAHAKLDNLMERLIPKENKKSQNPHGAAKEVTAAESQRADQIQPETAKSEN